MKVWQREHGRSLGRSKLQCASFIAVSPADAVFTWLYMSAYSFAAVLADK
jgi:hypothetical protein